MIVCQTKKINILKICSILLPILFSSCATKKEVVDERLKIISEWGKDVPERFYVKDENGISDIHPFFDVDPKVENFTADQSNGFVNYVQLTPRDSSYEYNIDLQSGKFYKQKNYCELQDAWKKFKGNIEKTNVTVGFLPRVLDHNKQPYKILILSENKFLEKYDSNPKYFEKAKVIGSILIERCGRYLCLDKEDWVSEQILVGLSQKDPLTKEVNTIEKVHYLINWDYLKAFIENTNGVSFVSGKAHPKVRVVKFFTLDNSLQYFKDHSSLISNNRMDLLKNWRQSCFDLYDTFYAKAEEIRKGVNPGERFYQFFIDFYANKKTEFEGCLSMVKPSNILQDIDRHWFFSHIEGVLKLINAGYYYQCNNGAWSYNPRHADGSFYVNQETEFRRCRVDRFEKMFETLNSAMALMRTTEKNHYKYLEYDNGAGGTHAMVYAWIYDDSASMNCKNKQSMGHQTMEEFLPDDVSWKKFKTETEKIVR